MSISPVHKCSYRDKAVIDAIEDHQALNTYQIAALLFRFDYGLRKAQARLFALWKHQRIKRVQLSSHEPTIYFLDKPHGRLEHLVKLNWVYVWARNTLPNGHTFYYWNTEQDYQVLQADALLGIKNLWTKQTEWTFVEMERSESHNSFKKVEQYNELFDRRADLLKDCWWTKEACRFPRILIVTDSLKKMGTIEKSITTDNKNNLRFEVKLLSEIIEEARGNE